MIVQYFFKMEPSVNLWKGDFLCDSAQVLVDQKEKEN